jgi:hypothetical protein
LLLALGIKVRRVLIEHPLGHVAVHVVQAPGVRLLAADLLIFLAAVVEPPGMFFQPGRIVAGGELHDRRHSHSGSREQPLAGHLVERQPAGLRTASGIDEPTILEDLLELPVLAELPVQGQEEHVDVPAVQDRHVIRPNVRRHNFDPTLPQSLGEAIDAFSADTVLREAVGENLAQEFIKLKRREWIEYSRHVSAWETNRYLEFF